MQCDMCGNSGTLYKITIEGTEMAVCSKCSSFGKVIAQIRPELKTGSAKSLFSASNITIEKKVPTEIIAENYAEIIRKKREQLGMTQKEFSAYLTEKESTMHKMESGHFEPDIKTARKLERLLKVRLVEKYDDKKILIEEGSHGNRFTIGDLIVIKKRKN